MGFTDVLSIGAFAVSTVSATFAGLAWLANRRAANANLRQAAAAEQQTELLQQQLELERTHRLAEVSSAESKEASQARLVSLELSGMGGIAVRITNHSAMPVMHVQLDDVHADTRPTLAWRLNPRASGNRPVRDILAAGTSARFWVEFTDERGEPVRLAGDTYTITYSFTDASGQRWRRVGNSVPEKVNG